jgi:hypothetical protein
MRIVLPTEREDIVPAHKASPVQLSAEHEREPWEWIDYDNRGTGEARTGSPEALRNIYRLAPDTRLFLIGTDEDPPIELWWGPGIRRAAAITQAMREAGVGRSNL